jgi:hypothetical protein
MTNSRAMCMLHRESCAPSHEPRISVKGFFAGRVAPPARVYGPTKELLSEENPPKYRDVLVSEYVGRFFTEGLHENSSVNDYRLQTGI